MREIYSRFVLWLIRPALELRHEQSRASPQEMAAGLAAISAAISESRLLNELR